MCAGVWTGAYVYKSVCTYAYMCTQVHVYTGTCVQVHICACVCIQMHMYMHVCLYVETLKIILGYFLGIIHLGLSFFFFNICMMCVCVGGVHVCTQVCVHNVCIYTGAQSRCDCLP